MTSHSSCSSDKDWNPSPERSTYRQPPVMEIGINCKYQNKPPVRLKSPCVPSPQSHPKMIGVACEEKPPVRLKSVSASTRPPKIMPVDQCSTTSSHASMCSRPTHKKIGIECADKPPVRLKWMLTHSPALNGILLDTVNGVRPEEEPQGSIWFLTHAILLSQHSRALDLSCQREDRCPVRSKRTSKCYRLAHRKEFGIGCAEKPPVRLKSFKIYRMDRDPEQLISEHLNQFSKS